MKIGFIGVGVIGGALSKKLLKDGFELTIYDINEYAMKKMTSLGALAVKSPREVAESSDFILTCLPSPEALETVILGDEGVLEAKNSNQVIIDLGTTGPRTIEKIEALLKNKGIELLDAPMTARSGTDVEKQAEQGKLTIMVGGKREVYEKCKQIFQSIGGKVFYVGESGCGATTKLVSNLISLVKQAVVVEGFALGMKAGLDKETLYKVISNGTGNSWQLKRFWDKSSKGDYEPGFTLQLARKDLRLILQMGRRLNVPLLLTTITDQMYGVADSKGLSQRDYTALTLAYEELLNIND